MKEDLWHALYSLATATGLAFIGRFMWHVIQVQRQNRRFWSMHLLWELLIALCLGYTVEGLAEYFDLMGPPATAFVILASYLGPRGIEEILARIIAAKKC